MKRTKGTIGMALAMTLAMGSTAFGADMHLYKNGAEQTLQHPLWKNNGQMMLSVDDFTALTGGRVLDEDEKNIFLRVPAAAEGSVWMEYSYDLLMAKEDDAAAWTLAGQEKDGEWYIPLREAMIRADWKTTWSKNADVETIALEMPVMPRISAEVNYDKETNMATVAMRNKEPQQFLYGRDYFLQKWDGQAWQDVPLVMERFYDDVGYTLSGNWEIAILRVRDFYDMKWYGDSLSAGKYRLCIPLNTVIYRVDEAGQEEILSTLETAEKKAERNAAMELYYKTDASQPAFTIPAGQERLSYILSSEFEVK